MLGDFLILVETGFISLRQPASLYLTSWGICHAGGGGVEGSVLVCGASSGRGRSVAPTPRGGGTVFESILRFGADLAPRLFPTVQTCVERLLHMLHGCPCLHGSTGVRHDVHANLEGDTQWVPSEALTIPQTLEEALCVCMYVSTCVRLCMFCGCVFMFLYMCMFVHT